MATRFYFPTTTASEINPAFASGWTYTTEALRRKMVKTKGSSAITLGTQIGPWTSGQVALDRQYVSDPMPAGIDWTGVTVKMQLMTREFVNTDNSKCRMVLKIVNSSGVVQQTLLSLNDYGSNLEYINNATCRNHTWANGDVVAGTYVTSAGDRLVVEIGHTDAPAGTTPEGACKFGENATDLPENQTQTSNGAGWLEVSVNCFAVLKTATADAILKKAQTLAASLDAALKKAFTKTATIDAALLKAFTKTATMDAEVIAGTSPTKQATMNAILKKAQALTSAIDAILKKPDQLKTTAVDATLQKAFTKTATINKSIDYGSDGNYLSGDGNYIIGDGNFIGNDFSDIRINATVDAVLKKQQSKTALFDGVLVNSNTKTATADAALMKQQTLTASADAVLKGQRSVTALIDAMLYIPPKIFATMDAILESAGRTITTALDAILVLAGTKTATYDAILKKSQTKSATIDAALQKSQTKTATLDAMLVRQATKSATIGAVLKGAIQVTCTMDAELITAIKTYYIPTKRDLPRITRTWRKLKSHFDSLFER